MGAVLVAPDCLKGIGWTVLNASSDHAFAVLDMVVRTCRIDPDRVYLDGYAMGAQGGWYMLFLRADRFAAAGFRSGLPMPRQLQSGKVTSLRLNNLACAANAPFMLVIGDSDPTISKDLRKILETQLKAAGANMNYILKEGGLDPYLSEQDAIIGWWTKHKRERHPAQLRFEADEDRYRGAYWLEVVKQKKRESGTVNIRGLSGSNYAEKRDLYIDVATAEATLVRESNRIDIKSTNIDELRVYIADEMLDLTKEVEITLNGSRKFKGTVERSVEKMLQAAARRGDRSITYANWIGIAR